MTKFQKISWFLLRITMGWMFFYAGITKVINPAWSAEGFLREAKTLPEFYEWLASPSVLPVVNFLNEWGLTLLGVSLMLGIMLRVSTTLGAVLMFLYYLVALDFPYPNTHAFIVDEHIIYIAALLSLSAVKAGRIWGLETWCSKLPICVRYLK